MCETSKNPPLVRTWQCSSMIERYSMGISQPANSTILAPLSTWNS